MRIVQPSTAVQRLPNQFFARLVSKVKRLKDQGHDVINLGQGNPDKPTPQHIVKAMQQATADPKYHAYGPFRGFPGFREEISAFYQREYGVVIDPEHEISIVGGAKAGLVHLCEGLLNPDDIALVPDPGYPDYWSGIAMVGAQMHPMPLTAENEFLPDYRLISSQTLQKAKLMLLNYPNNPTGAIATNEFFQETVALAEEYDISVIHDFAYGGIGFEGKRPISFLQTPGAKDVGIELYTMSKTYNMAGWRIAFAVGNASIIETLNVLQDHYYCSVFGATQAAAAAALSGPQDCVTDMVNLYESRRRALVESMLQIGWNITAPQGSFFAWLPVPKGWSSAAFSDMLLEQAHVMMAPGIGFGEGGEGYVRVGLIVSEARIEEAAKRIEKLGLFS